MNRSDPNGTFQPTMERTSAKRAGSNRGKPNVALLEARMAKDLSVEELAGRAGISGKQIRRISKGRVTNPTMETKRSIASALGVPVSDVFPAHDLRRIHHGGTALIDFLKERKDRGLSQRAMADDIGVTRRVYQSAESGLCQPRGESALAFAKYFDCAVTDIWPARVESDDAELMVQS